MKQYDPRKTLREQAQDAADVAFEAYDKAAALEIPMLALDFRRYICRDLARLMSEEIMKQVPVEYVPVQPWNEPPHVYRASAIVLTRAEALEFARRAFDAGRCAS